MGRIKCRWIRWQGCALHVGVMEVVNNRLVLMGVVETQTHLCTDTRDETSAFEMRPGIISTPCHSVRMVTIPNETRFLRVCQ